MVGSIRMVFFMALFTLVGCKNSSSTKNKGTKVELSAPDEYAKPLSLFNQVPEISTSALSSELRESIEGLTNKINQSLPNLKKTTTKILLDNIPNTPVSIWYAQDEPVKLIHGVPDITGKIYYEFSYYMRNGNIWYADQIHTKYIFQDQKLTYWVNSKWEINHTHSDDLAERGQQILDHVQGLIDMIH